MSKKDSNIILLNDGLYSYTPQISPPSNEREIINHEYKKSEQFWHIPKYVDVKKLSMRERIEYIERERQRWWEGCYCFINGNLVYLTGLHYEHLTLNTYNSQKLLYFDDERFIFYFIDLSENDPTCDGRTWIKPRRAKMTTIMCSLAQRKLLSDFSNYITIQSDTLDKAQKSYMSPIIDSYVRRPLWSRESYYAPNGKKPRKALELTSNVVVEEGNELMGGKINIFPTTAKATDGLEAVECIQDEFSKVEDTSPYEMFEVNRKVIQNFRKQGKIDCLSSTGDSKDAAKATMDWHKLIANSNPLRKDQFGKTGCGLWEYFISAIHSQYVPKEFTDIFGIVNKEKAEEWVWNEIKKYPEGTREYIFALYKLPLKKEHALLSAAITNLFSKPRISARLTELEGMMPSERPYVRGRLEEDQKGNVWFEEDPAGYWLWAIHPYFSVEKKIDTRNRFRRSDQGVWWPPINPEGVIGYDPINYPKGQTKSSNISQAAGFIRKKFDYFGSGIEDEVMAFLLYRPEDPHDANREIMKACRYTGFPCMHERSIPHVHEDFRDNNMLPFLMKGEDDLYGILANVKNLKDGISMLQARYAPPKTPEQKDQIMSHPFEDCLRSHDNFDPSNTNQFDPTMSEIMCEHGLKQLKFTNQTDYNNDNAMQLFREMIAPRQKTA
jgi:hypothetical protein